MELVALYIFVIYFSVHNSGDRLRIGAANKAHIAYAKLAPNRNIKREKMKTFLYSAVVQNANP